MQKSIISYLGRGACIVAAILLVAVTWHIRQQRSRAMSEVGAILEEFGVQRAFPDTARRLMRELDPQWARLRTARILAVESREDPTSDQPSDRTIDLGDRRKRLRQRLETADDLATQVGLERPAVWQASMWKGATTYLRWSIDRDPRLLSQRSRWEKPLLHASELAPGEKQPKRFLSAAYLEVWPALTQEEVETAKIILSTAMEDPAVLRAFIGPWLAQAPDIDEAFSIIPDNPGSWSLVRSYLAQSADFSGFIRAHRRWERSVKTEIETLLSEMERHLTGGDPAGARKTVGQIVALAPPDLRYRDSIVRAVTRRPPGSGTQTEVRGSRAWLEWGLEGAMRGFDLMPPVVFERLAAVIDDLPEAQRATALLISGNLIAAEAIERRREDINTEPWAPYCLTKARILISNGNTGGARAIFRKLHRSFRTTPIAEKIAFDLSQDSTDVEPWWLAIPGLTTTEWHPTRWKWRDRTAWLDFVPEEAGNALTITLDVVPSGGAAVEVQLDFRGVWTGAVEPGQEIILDLPIEPGPHTLRIRTLAGGRVIPGKVASDVASADARVAREF